jgi:capsule polysaccharide export protein KpsC/LpsZ
MAYIATPRMYKVGDKVITSKIHANFEVGSEVTIFGVDPFPGYGITDDFDNIILGIGWEV